MSLHKFAGVLDGIQNLYVPTEDLEEKIAHASVNVVLFTTVALIILILTAALIKNKVPKAKLPLFSLIASLMVGSTLFLAASTVYLNVKSDSKGPVHWHADTEFWVCDNQLELRDPTGTLSNKIGTSTLHEHDDQRIHLEGVVVDDTLDASLGKFFHVIGGAITNEAMVVPLNAPERGNYFEDEVDGDGDNPGDLGAIKQFIVQGDDGPYVRLENGQTCADSNQESHVQVFVITQGEDDTYTQRKLDNPKEYVIRDDPNVPPGDCIIFEFGPMRDRTDKLCEQYGIRDKVRCDEFLSDEKLCKSIEVDENGNEITAEQKQEHEAIQVETDETAASQTSAPAPGSETPDPQQIAEEEELIALCAQFFNEDGTPTGIEIAAIKSNGDELVVDTECESYRQELLGNPATTVDQEEN